MGLKKWAKRAKKKIKDATKRLGDKIKKGLGSAAKKILRLVSRTPQVKIPISGPDLPFSLPQSEGGELIEFLNQEFSNVWQHFKPEIEARIHESVKKLDERENIRDAKAKTNLNSPPVFLRFNNKEIAIKVPSTDWDIGIKLLFKTRTKIEATIKNLFAALLCQINDTDPERPTVTSARIAITFDKLILKVPLGVVLLAFLISIFTLWALFLFVTLVIMSGPLLGILFVVRYRSEADEKWQELRDEVSENIIKIKNSATYAYDILTKGVALVDLPKPPLGENSPVMIGTNIINGLDDLKNLGILKDEQEPSHNHILDFDEAIRNNFMHYDIIVSIQPTQPPKFSNFWNSGYYTGLYLMAKSLQYDITKDPEALSDAKRALKGIKRLFDVASSNRFLAYGVEKSGAGNGEMKNDEYILSHFAAIANEKTGCPDPDKTWLEFFKSYRGKAEDVPIHLRQDENGIEWVGWSASDGFISRDEYAGVLTGLTFAYRFIDDAEVKDTVKNIISRILNYFIRRKWFMYRPDGKINFNTFNGEIHLQFPMLLLGVVTNPDNEMFKAELERLLPLKDFVWFPVWLSTFETMEHYYKYSLSHAALACAMLLEFDPDRLTQYRRAMRILRRALGHHQVPYFTGYYCLDDELKNEMISRNMIELGSDWRILAQLYGFLRRPMKADDKITSGKKMPTGEITSEMQLFLDSTPKMPYTAINMEKTVKQEAREIAKDIIPIEMRPPRIWLWANPPFRYWGGAEDIFYPGVDYLCSFWLARKTGLVSDSWYPLK